MPPAGEIASEYIIDFDSRQFYSFPQNKIDLNYMDLNNKFESGLSMDIEIGFGTGDYLLKFAETNPRQNILGIEIVKKMVWLAAKRAHQRGLKNLRLVNGDASLFIKHRIDNNSINGVHVYFPDPWLKKRHHKRRLISTDFLNELCRVIRTDGFVDIATDNEEYFTHILDALSRVKGLNEEKHAEPLLTPTRYQTKWEKQGRSIMRLFLKKE
ncbi:MAG: tRNA (guanosine(46)-N7)-methyltransferase TrmB [bacterium]